MGIGKAKPLCMTEVIGRELLRRANGVGFVVDEYELFEEPRIDLRQVEDFLERVAGPEGLADIRPFLANVLRGRRVSPERVEEVAHHYEMFGGVSPITEGNAPPPV